MSLFDRFRSSRDLEEEVLRLRREIRSLERGPRATSSSAPLLAVARALRDARSVEAFAGPAIVVALEIAGGTRGALVLPDESGTLRAAVARTVTGETVPPVELVVSQGIAKESADGGRPIATGSAAEDERFRAFKSVKDYGIGSVLCLPVRRHEGPTGCLYLEGGSQGLRRADPAQLLAVSDLISIALDRLALDADVSRRERLEAVGLAAASIAHDLKTPLATAELALEAAASAPEHAAKAAPAATRALARAREIAQHLAAFARGSEQSLVLVAVPLGDLVREHVAEWRPVLERSRVKPSLELAYEGPVLGDRGALHRVLSNLTKNAVEAMPAGGTIAYRSSVESGRARLTVADEGRGIPADVLPKLFRPFATFGKEGGCGLGLALSRELLASMRGSIRAESDGKGTRFHVELATA